MRNNRFFKSYTEAWEFIYSMIIHGYDYDQDYDKQAEACEAFRMMREAARLADKTVAKEYDDIDSLRHFE